MKAMILAAGKGERMRPLTLTTPKPLIEVHGNPLIVHHILNLKAAGIEDIVINVSWLAEKIVSSLKDGRQFGVNITYSQEPTPLETAGGIRQALPLLISANGALTGNNEQPFIVVNGDIYTDFNFATLRNMKLKHAAHVVLADNPPHHPEGDFCLTDGWLNNTGDNRLTFCGISLLSRKIIEDYDPQEQKLGPLIRAAADKGQVSAEHHRGIWHDIGTPERLQTAINSTKQNL
ncbi:MAG: nucleotidyltransferase family protein [Hahellaceae bacterium]|nr:nucleotidyltransferase family protein [Hahellaceae bacterium]